MKKLAQITVDSITPQGTNFKLDEQGITQSLVADFATCRQRFLFRVNGWRLDEQKSEPLFFGSLCHKVLEAFYTQGKKSLNIHRMVQAYASEHWKDVDEALLLKAEALLTIYAEVFKDDRDKITPIRTEEVFETPAFGALLRGRKDLVFEINKSKKKWMREHKTKSRIDHEYLGFQLAHDIQNLFYDLSEKEEHGIPFTGISYNILKRPGQRPKKDETASSFLERLKDEIRAETSDYFFRYEVTFTKMDRARFENDLAAKIEDMQAYLSGKLRHYRNEAACQTPFRCPYLGACTSGFMTGYKKSKIIFPELEADAS